jgi:DNA-binding transcriptional ArsR family regulator
MALKQARQLSHPKPAQITLSRVLHALSDPVRLSIVAKLSDGRERSSSGFKCDVANSTLSHHMKVLRLAGLIKHRKDGTRCFVSLRPELEVAFPGLVDSILRFQEGTSARHR